MIFKKQSFKFKLIFSYFLVVLFSFGLVAFFLDKKLEENSLQDLKSSLINQANLIETQISTEAIQNESLLYLSELVKNFSQKNNARLTIIGLSGKVLADSEKSQTDLQGMENHASRPEFKQALVGSTGESIRYSSTLRIDMLYVAIPLRYKKAVIGAIRVALPLENVRRNLLVIRKAVTLGFLFALGLAFVFGSMLAGTIIKPVNKIIHASRRFSLGDFSRKILHDSQDEIGELARTLNKMAEDIEEKVREITIQSQQLTAVFNSMIEGVVVLDKESRIVSINSAIEKIFAIKKKEAQGKLFLEVIRNSDIAEEISRALKKGESVSRELILSWPVQGVFQVNVAPIYEKQGMINGSLLVLHDITEIRKLETMRRDFVANVSHELKTPLTSIKGFVETLLEGALNDKENSLHFLEIVHEHTNRLDNLINDLLELSRIESREIELDSQEIKLRDLFNKVILGFTSQLNKKNIKIENNLQSGLMILADKDKIEQVITNLLANAIKFNRDNGFVKIYSQDLTGKTKVIVEDSGIGIPTKDLPRIFERFYRVDKARSRELGGTGLGLSIVKHIIELHKGSVGVESVEGLGSKFWFNLPI
ncbi:MAG: cell wall metabolism sensor histidine kinase WalK [Candidatus Omnitrophica bacterium]|jgi:two-component system phosphate regulon sensor histidine kinase PhoR|nr:cell wall metabolism sensor histidine kinase WalK [Candidatus Omnitrophota bacterium]